MHNGTEGGKWSHTLKTHGCPGQGAISPPTYTHFTPPHRTLLLWLNFPHSLTPILYFLNWTLNCGRRWERERDRVSRRTQRKLSSILDLSNDAHQGRHDKWKMSSLTKLLTNGVKPLNVNRCPLKHKNGKWTNDTWEFVWFHSSNMIAALSRVGWQKSIWWRRIQICWWLQI